MPETIASNSLAPSLPVLSLSSSRISCGESVSKALELIDSMRKDKKTAYLTHVMTAVKRDKFGVILECTINWQVEVK